MMIEGERSFRSYRLIVHFIEPGDLVRPSDVAPKPGFRTTWIERRGPAAWIDDPTPEQINTAIQEFWDVQKENHPGFEAVRFEIKEQERETWIQDWFSHWTFRLGRTDQELIRSFGNFVLRTECHNERVRYTGEGIERCLMGAEDRYRWRGDGRKDTEPPCSCEHCQKLGITRIDH